LQKQLAKVMEMTDFDSLGFGNPQTDFNET